MACKSNKSVLLINSAVLLALGIALYGLSKQKQSIVQRNYQYELLWGYCSGGHYQETDTEPPEYIRRCFRKDLIREKLSMIGTGFHCSTTGSGECCPGLRK